MTGPRFDVEALRNPGGRRCGGRRGQLYALSAALELNDPPVREKP